MASMRRWTLPLLIALVIMEIAIFGSYLWISRPQTRFASGFNEKVFRGLELGTSPKDVTRVLGPPLATREVENLDKTTVTVWYYSEPLAKSFKHRALVFDRSQRLVQKV